jgi:hypothetical protein
MIKFHSLLDALNYQPKCPMCHSETVVDGRYNVQLEQSCDVYLRAKRHLIWNSASDEMVVDLDSDKILSFKKMDSLSSIPGITFGISSTANYASGSAMSWEGRIYHRLGVGCDECCKYSYLVQVIVDTSSQKICDIVLNSETLTFEMGDGITHEIKNVYTFGETEYFYFTIPSRNGDKPLKSKIVFPLMTIDAKHPEKTLERIRNLVPFL